MANLDVRKLAVIAAHALVLWLVCGALMFGGMSLASLDTALVIHALGAPVVATLVSWHYFKRFPYTTAIVTACLFVGMVIFLDVFVVALLIEQSFAMFTSFTGTWLPFILIFGATYLTGHFLTRRPGAATAA
jgi:hypothetical protein